MVTLIDTFSHFEVHVELSAKAPERVCSIVCQGIHQAIFKGLSKATLNLHYSNSIPSLALLCSCGEGNAHVALPDADLGLWICANDKKICGELTSQLLWLECCSQAVTTVAVPDTHRDGTLVDDNIMCLTEFHLPELELQLKDHASHWRDIGTHLGFRQGELDNIQSNSYLQQVRYLRAMLYEWFQWSPGDS